jgi:hypothetical protein
MGMDQSGIWSIDVFHLLMRSPLDNLTVFEHDYFITVTYRTQSMGYDDAGATSAP